MSEQISYSQELLRKLVHLSSLWMVISIGTFSRLWNLFLFSALLIILVVIEYGNFKRWPLVVSIYGKLFNNMLRKKERHSHFRLSGAPYVIASALIVVLLFERSIAMTALSTMLIGDTFAALVGRKFGKHKINENTKSVEGSIAFWMSSSLILLFFFYIYDKAIAFFLLGLIGITIAMFAEIYEKQIKVDDNFSIPILVGAFLSITCFLPN